MTKICCWPGCNSPRAVTANGNLLTYCRDHQRERARKNSAMKKKPGAPYKHRASSATRTAKSEMFSALDEEALPDGYRRCGQCRQVKPESDFQKHGVIFRGACKACSAARMLEVEMSKESAGIQIGPVQTPKRMMLVDRDRGQVILCQVLSEIPAQARHVDMIIEFYAQQGYRIVDAVERVEAHHGHA